MAMEVAFKVNSQGQLPLLLVNGGSMVSVGRLGQAPLVLLMVWVCRCPHRPEVPDNCLAHSCSRCGGAAAGCTVFLEEGHAAEGTGTHATLVLLHLSVGLQVRPQVGAVGEGTVTVLAGERPLT